jgi:hypothetical protein
MYGTVKIYDIFPEKVLFSNGLFSFVRGLVSLSNPGWQKYNIFSFLHKDNDDIQR